MKTAQQSIWPVSVFGLGFMLLIMGLSGVANIQETRQIHQQILAVEDNYRRIENLIEGIRTETSRVAVLRRDRLLKVAGFLGTNYSDQLTDLRMKISGDLERLKSVRPQQSSQAVERLGRALGSYLNAVAREFQQAPAESVKPAFVDDGFGSETTPIFAIAEELGKLNEESFESRRKELSDSVANLENDIWETILTALVLGAIIAGASIFRISSLEKETAAHQKATAKAEDRLRLLSQQLVSSQEQERKSLSRELHDEIGQLLTALRMELGNMERSRPANGEADPHLEQAKKLAESTLKTTRDIAMGLRPAMLDVLGLGPALEWQTREYSRRYHTPIQLEVDGDLKDVPDPHRTYLYRIVQEGLTNCARHAHAKNIRVKLEDADGQIAAVVEDDGVGFDQDGGVAYGLGLLGITERVRELSGNVSIQSEPGKGTRIAVVLPLAGARPPANKS